MSERHYLPAIMDNSRIATLLMAAVSSGDSGRDDEHGVELQDDAFIMEWLQSSHRWSSVWNRRK